jgi:hypothetical protein
MQPTGSNPSKSRGNKQNYSSIQKVCQMNCLFFTTVFKVFTQKSRFFTTTPSILTTQPSILTTQLCSLKSKLCSDLGLGRHEAHKIEISGDALTVSAASLRQ